MNDITNDTQRYYSVLDGEKRLICNKCGKEMISLSDLPHKAIFEPAFRSTKFNKIIYNEMTHIINPFSKLTSDNTLITKMICICGNRGELTNQVEIITKKEYDDFIKESERGIENFNKSRIQKLLNYIKWKVNDIKESIQEKIK